jgi:hypothetical protein
LMYFSISHVTPDLQEAVALRFEQQLS